MSWEDIVRETLAVIFTVGVTLFLIILAWMVMWHFFLSKIRFVREILFPDSDENKKDSELRSKRDRRQRKDR